MKFIIIFAFILTITLPESRGVEVPANKPIGHVHGAHNAREGQFPYLVGLILYFRGGRKSWCGGTLISNTDVITAAHCVYHNVYQVDVQLGVIRNSAKVQYAVFRESITLHPNWSPEYWRDDIAIIKIPYTNYSTYIQPAKLPSASKNFDYQTVLSLGWGVISGYTGAIVSHMQYSERVILPNRYCRYQFLRISPTKYCVSGYDGASNCEGDTDGPLVLNNTNILVAIDSTAAKGECAQTYHASVTRVSNYLDWIKQNMNATL